MEQQFLLQGTFRQVPRPLPNTGMGPPHLTPAQRAERIEQCLERAGTVSEACWWLDAAGFVVGSWGIS